MLAVVVNRVHSSHPPAVVVERLPRGWINIKTREIATGDIDSDAVTFLEDHCDRVHVYRKVESRGKVLTGWINVNQFGSEIGVGRGRRSPELHQQRSCDFDIFLQGLSLENEHIVSGGERARVVAVP